MTLMANTRARWGEYLKTLKARRRTPDVEKLAVLEHERWSGWMRYLFTKGTFNEDHSFTIEASSVARWRRQMQTPYEQLSDREKESDRAEVRKTLAVLTERL